MIFKKIICSGNLFNQGLSQGNQIKKNLSDINGSLKKIEAFTLLKPWWAPYSMFKLQAQKKARMELEKRTRGDWEGYFSFLEGLSQSSGINLETLCLLNVMEPLLSSVVDKIVIPQPGACSAIAYSSKDSNPRVFLFKNFDYISVAKPYFLVRERQPDRGYRSLEFGVAPLSGTIDGINEKGLGITFNYAYVNDSSQRGVPISYIISRALTQCSSVDEAIDFISSAPRWGAGLLMVVDANGDKASLELSNTRFNVRRGDEFLFHTNMFITKKMKKMEIDPRVIYTNKAPKALRGRVVLESAIHRYRRIEELILKSSSFETVDSVLCDHGPNNEPADQTVCVHGPYWNTVGSFKYFPIDGRIEAAWSYRCEAKFTSYAFENRVGVSNSSEKISSKEI